MATDGTRLWAGEQFTVLGGLPRLRLGVLDLGTGEAVSSWVAHADGTVDALAVSGNTLYAAGNFITVAGTSRRRLAALDAATAALLNWGTDANRRVRALALSADTVYVGFDSSVDGRIWSSLPDNATAFNPIVASATGKMFHTSGLSVWNVSQGGSPGPAFVGNYLRVRIMLDNATSSTLPRAKVYIVYPAVLGGDR